MDEDLICTSFPEGLGTFFGLLRYLPLSVLSLDFFLSSQTK